MLATIISDVYTIDERSDVANAIDDLCSPNDAYGWSSCGVYGFWEPMAKDAIYLGLTGDF